jgi:hypothetical protein
MLLNFYEQKGKKKIKEEQMEIFIEWVLENKNVVSD